MDEDLKLIERFQKGDERAFTELYHRYFLIVLQFFEREPLTCNDAQDHCQEIFIKLFRNLKYGKVKNFKALLGSALRTKKIDAIRQKSRYKLQIMSLLMDFSTESASDEKIKLFDETSNTNPFDEVHFEELERIVAECLDQIIDERRRIIAAYKLENLKEQQIAELVKANPNTVSSNWGRAKKFLRLCVQKKLQGILSKEL
ncbi:RNA polymerase sigma factor [candidate division KSB1 bacterium]|nr:RNA polymerase sigma factor [candidate division KSB1 bacterium]